MKSIPHGLLALLLISILTLSCSSNEEIPTTFVDESFPNTEMETEILGLINKHRTDLNLPALEILGTISKEAAPHTDYMISKGQISHDYFVKRHKNLVVKANAIAVSENVAKGYRSANSVVKAWLASDKHKTNIEDPKLTHTGISTKRNDEGNFYFTNIFIEK